jgi:hypothetical protein
MNKLAQIFHVPAAFICKALRGTAVVFYCKPLITQQTGASGSAQRVKIFQLKKKKLRVQNVTWKLLLVIDLSQYYYIKQVC